MKHNNFKTLLLCTLVIAGCAKEKPYKEVLKRKVYSKKDLLEICSAKDPCLYVPSVTNTPYEVPASRPFWQGEQKLVVTHMTEKELQFLQIDEDKRFSENINNLSPVLNISVSHVDYKCSEDEYGDCTNKETVDEEKNWDEKRFVQVGDVKVVEVNTLPIQMGELFRSGCFTQTGTELSKMDIEADAVNIVVKKSYSSNASCARLESYEDLRYLNFTVDYAYSLVKLSSISDPNYEQITYPSQDESSFGFFKTEHKGKTVDNHDHVVGVRKTLMNRWSPNKKDIVYYLNSDFYLPEMKVIKKATYDAIESVNNSLEKANAGIQIKLEKGDDSKLGDLRNNFIILVRDPQASGVIGYGPSVTNPRTGEILNARTVMYYGTIQKFVSKAYDGLVDEILAKNNAGGASDSSPIGVGRTNNVDTLFSLTNVKLDTYIQRDIDEAYYAMKTDMNASVSSDNVFASLGNQNMTEIDFEKIYAKQIKGHTEHERFIMQLAKDTFFHGENLNFEGAVLDALSDKLKKGKKPKYWEQLTEGERAKLMKELVPYVWVPTLVHEFGHNPGLRHNFYGSVDKENYYSKQESRALGMRKTMSYSSIMDYAYRQNNELTVMGKYDIAALRFAYAREVELSNGKFVKLETTLKDSIIAPEVKKYKYCSDEHVPSNPLCNRFDEGSTHQDLVKHYISQYEKNYKKVNFRKRRYSFDGFTGDANYMNYLIGTFFNVRQFFDSFDQAAFNGAYDEDGKWKTNPTLVDIKKASDISFKFFVDILEEPAYHCIVIDKASMQEIQTTPFNKLIGQPFDIANGCDFLNQRYAQSGKYLFAEFGKYFNNTLDITLDRGELAPGSDQIDVRGMWMDKIIASFVSTLRMNSASSLGPASTGNYFDYPMYRNRLMQTIDAYLQNSMTKVVNVKYPNGKVIAKRVNYTFDDNHNIYKSRHPGINYFFGLHSASVSYKNVFFDFLKSKLINSESDSDLESINTLAIYDSLNVKKFRSNNDLSLYRFDKVVDFKDKDGKLRFRFGIYEKNTRAMELAKMNEDLTMLMNQPEELVVAAFRMKLLDDVTLDTLRASAKFTEDQLSTIEILAEVDTETIYGHMTGTLTNQVLLSSMLALSK